MSIEETYICPEGNVYSPGDIAEVIRLPHMTLYNEQIEKVIQPGYAGYVEVQTPIGSQMMDYDPQMPDEVIVRWIVQPVLENPSIFIVAPRSETWRWSYASREVVREEAHRGAMISMFADGVNEEGGMIILDPNMPLEDFPYDPSNGERVQLDGVYDRREKKDGEEE